MQDHVKRRLNNINVNVMAAIAIGAMLVFSVAGTKAFADNVQDDIVTGSQTRTITAGGSTTVNYWIEANGQGGFGGCDAADGSSVKITFNAPNGVTVSPESRTFNKCGDTSTQSATYSSNTPGTYSITVSASDSTGSYNPNPAKLELKVEAAQPPSDETAPVLTLPDDITEEATGPDGAEVTYTATATDAVDGSITPECTPASGSIFPLGTTEVTCTATDAAENTATGSFTVTVTAPRDTAAPELSLPDDITEEATGPDGAEVTYTATATDAVDGSITPECTPASGSIFPLGTTEVTCTATDAAENTATGSFTVTVQDTTPPTLTLPSAPPAAEATSPQGAEVTYGAATATDLVDGSITPECTPASGSIFPLGTTEVTCTATDAAENTATGSFNVKVQDTIKPEIKVTSAISDGQQFYFGNVPSAPTCTATDSGSGVNSDGCKVTGYATTVGPQTLTFTATDIAGNTATQTIKYTVLPWTLKGFYQPVDMDASSIVTNTVKGGSVVPLKLEIFQGTTELTSTTFNNNPVGSFAPKKVSCTPGSTEDAIETLATPGSTVFRYDSTSGQFIYNWQTPKQPNACYDVIFTSLDGTTLTAHFKLK
jgi:hypothetical protein